MAMNELMTAVSTMVAEVHSSEEMMLGGRSGGCGPDIGFLFDVWIRLWEMDSDASLWAIEDPTSCEGGWIMVGGGKAISSVKLPMAGSAKFRKLI